MASAVVMAWCPAAVNEPESEHIGELAPAVVGFNEPVHESPACPAASIDRW
jgi:hypothetical protein